MRLWRELTIGALVTLLGACAHSGAETGQRRQALTSVHVAVVGDTAHVAAQLLDAGGRRTGWVKDGPAQDVPGCGYSYGWDSEIHDDEESVDSSDTAALEGPPRSHSFGIRWTERGRGVMSEGACDLQIESRHGGWVTVAAQAGITEPEQCQTRLREDLKADTTYRWRVTWKALGDTCAVTITRVSPKVATAGTR
jgi:hypothetical protein